MIKIFKDPEIQPLIEDAIANMQLKPETITGHQLLQVRNYIINNLKNVKSLDALQVATVLHNFATAKNIVTLDKAHNEVHTPHLYIPSNNGIWKKSLGPHGENVDMTGTYSDNIAFIEHFIASIEPDLKKSFYKSVFISFNTILYSHPDEKLENSPTHIICTDNGLFNNRTMQYSRFTPDIIAFDKQPDPYIPNDPRTPLYSPYEDLWLSEALSYIDVPDIPTMDFVRDHAALLRVVKIDNTRLLNEYWAPRRPTKPVNKLTPYEVSRIAMHFFTFITFKKTDTASRISLGIYAPDEKDELWTAIDPWESVAGLYHISPYSLRSILSRIEMYKNPRLDEAVRYIKNIAPFKTLTTEKQLEPIKNGIWDRHNRQLIDYTPRYVFIKKNDRITK